jgi:2'-hydroxyisoflavone reductase
VTPEWVRREAGGGAFPIWVPYMGQTRGFHTWKIERAVKTGLRFRPIAETAADTLRWYKGQPEGDRTKLAGPAADRETQLLAKWKARAGN